MLLVVSKYDAAETATWLEANDWTFPMLSDGGDVIESYGLKNENFSRPGHEGIPHPATIIIDKSGAVRFVNVWENYRERTATQTMLEELDKINEKQDD